MNIFNYSHPDKPSDCKYLISPSILHRFYENPYEWYLSTTGQGEGFKGNTASVTGTICHYIYEQFQKQQPIDKEEINRELEYYANDHPELELDVEKIKSDYVAVVNEVVNNYILQYLELNKLTETKMVTRYRDDIYLGGTIDRIDGDCIVDFKTVSKKPNTEIIPINYQLQLLCYAKIAIDNGYDINRIRIVYGVKPSKTLRARCIIVQQEIQNLDFLSQTLDLVYEALKGVEKYPQLQYIIFRPSLEEQCQQKSL